MRQLFRYLFRRSFLFAHADFDGGGAPELTGSGAKLQIIISRLLFSIPGEGRINKDWGGQINAPIVSVSFPPLVFNRARCF